MITCELVSYAGRIPLRRIGLHGAAAVSRREGRCRDSYEFLLQGHDYDSFPPSLQRQDVLNMAYGLYEVLPDRIYQVRGFDLANITFVKGTPGWIVFDPLTAKETARAALELVNEKLGRRPVVHRRKAGNAKAVINLVIPDNGETFVIELANATMASIKGYQPKAANLTITLARRDLETIMSGASSFEALLADGKAKFDGDCTAFDRSSSRRHSR